jgi:hypothetical protein
MSVMPDPASTEYHQTGYTMTKGEAKKIGCRGPVRVRPCSMSDKIV